MTDAFVVPVSLSKAAPRASTSSLSATRILRRPEPLVVTESVTEASWSTVSSRPELMTTLSMPAKSAGFSRRETLTTPSSTVSVPPEPRSIRLPSAMMMVSSSSEGRSNVIFPPSTSTLTRTVDVPALSSVSASTLDETVSPAIMVTVPPVSPVIAP